MSFIGQRNNKAFYFYRPRCFLNTILTKKFTPISTTDFDTYLASGFLAVAFVIFEQNLRNRNTRQVARLLIVGLHIA
ncbi:MAG: hypothetical protein L3J05_08015 [Robiginitomaculum sp.]|nr:hypothetical protein [Robiginitomaculum sp.]